MDAARGLPLRFLIQGKPALQQTLAIRRLSRWPCVAAIRPVLDAPAAPLAEGVVAPVPTVRQVHHHVEPVVPADRQRGIELFNSPSNQLS